VQLSDDANDIANADGAKSGRTIANGRCRHGLAGALVGKIGRTARRSASAAAPIIAPGAACSSWASTTTGSATTGATSRSSSE
jgi:hypothetical protein